MSVERQGSRSATAVAVAIIYVYFSLASGSHAAHSGIVHPRSQAANHIAGAENWSLDAPSSHMNGKLSRHGGLHPVARARQTWSCSSQNLSSSSTHFSIKSMELIKETSWVPQLKSKLENMNFQNSKSALLYSQHPIHVRKQVTVIFGDAKYALSILNWLVSALIRTTPPLENIIVISIDMDLHLLLSSKGLPSVYVDPETITCGKVHKKISRVWIARCAVYRLMAHWGYDVMAYDSDAIVLKNLHDILAAYPDSDVIGSSGFYPRDLGAKWGRTLCMGVALFRSTRKTETLWNIVNRNKKNLHVFDDQVNVNTALDKCNIKWTNSTSQDTIVTGQCVRGRLEGLKVTILPPNMICRRCQAEHKHSVYIWHKVSKKTGEMKVKTAVSSHTWFLKNVTLNLTTEDEKVLLENRPEEEGLKGVNWLRAISLDDVL